MRWLLLLLLALNSVPAEGGETPRRKRATELRLATYNVYVGASDLADTAAVIWRTQADVVALQEIVPDRRGELMRRLGGRYPYSYFGGGLGLISRVPLAKTSFERSRAGVNGFLFAEVRSGRRRWQIVNVHLDPLHIWTAGDLLTLPWQLLVGQRGIHRRELAQMFDQLEPGVPVILLGDFNRVNDSAIRQLGGRGFIDSYAAVNAEADRDSTLHFAIFGVRGGRRIDFIFHDRNFRTVRSEIVPGRPSDHDAVVSTLRVR